MASARVVTKAADRLREISRKLEKGNTLSIGFLANAKYPDGTSVALIAAIHNFGAPSRGIPPRPFFSNMVADKKGEWPAAIAALLKVNDYDVEKTLRQTGAAIKGQLEDAIINGNFVPLKPATVKRKGFSTPLIDTAHMLHSIDFEVK